jgi:hypothetical protein
VHGPELRRLIKIRHEHFIASQSATQLPPNNNRPTWLL